MTDQNPYGSTPPGEDPFATEGDSTANAKGSEWLSQLETMIQDIATQAAPVARQVAAKAAELTAVAAVKAGPLAQKAADATSDAGQKLAERAQNLATELRGEGAGTPAEGVSWDTTEDPTNGASTPTTPETTFGDTGASSGGMAPGTFEDETRRFTGAPPEAHRPPTAGLAGAQDRPSPPGTRRPLRILGRS